MHEKERDHMKENDNSIKIFVKSNILDQDLGKQILDEINNQNLLLQGIFQLEVRFDVRSYQQLPKSNRKDTIYKLLEDQLCHIEKSLVNTRININGTKMIGADLENKDVMEIILKKVEQEDNMHVNSIIPNETSLQKKIGRFFMDKYMKELEIEQLLDEL